MHIINFFLIFFVFVLLVCFLFLFFFVVPVVTIHFEFSEYNFSEEVGQVEVCLVKDNGTSGSLTINGITTTDITTNGELKMLTYI